MKDIRSGHFFGKFVRIHKERSKEEELHFQEYETISTYLDDLSLKYRLNLYINKVELVITTKRRV